MDASVAAEGDGSEGAAEPCFAWGDSDYNATLDEVFSDSSSDTEVLKIIFRRRRRNQKLLKLAFYVGMYHDTYFDKLPRRDPIESGTDWVERTLDIQPPAKTCLGCIDMCLSYFMKF